MHLAARSGELTAVLRTDIVGSTDVLNSRGVEAAMTMQRSARTALERVSGAGTLLEFRGDGALVGFRSAGDALDAAWHLREGIAGEDYQLRIAVTLEQSASGQTLSADAQERTQSFEVRCPPGSIVTDDRIRRAVRGHGEAAFRAIDPETHELTEFASGGNRNREANAVRIVLFSEPTARSSEAERAAADITRACIDQRGGSIINVQGGRFMATFGSCTDAMNTADEIHAAAASRNVRADATDTLAFRIAASAGEVVQAAEDSFGIAVIEAARLAAMADPGSTLVSADVVDLAGLDPTDPERRGLVALKGLSDPVDVACITHDGIAPPLLDFPSSLHVDRQRPMVGRETERNFLHERLEAAAHGSPSLVVVDGEEGIGKTRLVSELADRAHASGSIVLHGICEPDPRAPFAPVVDALERSAHLEPAVARAMQDGDGPLGAMFGVASPTSNSPSQAELFGAVADALGRLCQARTVLLVLDDVQWASVDTVRLMTDVLAALPSTRLLVLLTDRSDNIDRSEALEELLRGNHEGVRRHHVSLPLLTEQDVAAMIEARTSPGLVQNTPDLAPAIWKTAGGNPLYVDELLTHLITSHVLLDEPGVGWHAATDVAELSAPSSLIDLMSRRIARLGPDSCKALGVAALMGSAFDLEVLTAVTDHPVERMLDMIDAAIEARLLRSTQDGSFVFGDEIVRAAFLRHVPASRRPLLHERLAEAIEQAHPNRIDQLITHWSAAVGRHARGRLRHQLRLAAERDMAAAAWEAAVDRARTLLPLLDEDDLELECETRLVLGTALHLLGRDSYRPELSAAASLARRINDPERLLRAAVSMMRPGEWTPEAGVTDVEIVEICEDVLLLVDDPDDPIRIRALAALATNLAADANPRRRLDLVAEAQERARRSGDLRLLGRTLLAELLSSLGPRDFERRAEVAEELRRIGRAVDDSDLLFAGAFFSMLDALERGAVDTAESLLKQLRIIADTKRDFFSRYRVAYLTAVLALARCEPEARALADAAHQMAEGEPIDAFGPLVLQTGVLAMYEGTLSEILLPIAQASDMWDDSWTSRWDFALAKAYLDTGQHELATETIRNNPEPFFDSYWVSSYCQLAENGWLLGLPDVCTRAITHLTPFRGRFALVGAGLAVTCHVSVALGQAHMGLGDHGAAAEFFAEAVVQADQAGFAYFATSARRHLAQALLASDPTSDEARELLIDVSSAAEVHGFESERRVIANLTTG